ncbi:MULTISPECIES: GIY-YIG nuclease family protein [unclassified Psychrobacter]|uniref:GIY-YIG nuclease family protein n=1 Tax=unclassified Psychrobacter TaxID=196806 RepID=UPI0025E9B592|nr:MULTISPECIES: GIY-YIG nuclease family protein [unclassified Psychrobacter]
MKNSFLYILVYSNLKVVKIGKANNISKRINVLKSSWGEPDLDKSYTLELCESKVYKIEKAMHALFIDHQVLYDDGDGKTELFNLDILPKVIDILNYYTNFLTDESTLKLGIDPIVFDSIKKINNKDREVSNFEKSQRQLITTLEQIHFKLEKIMRIISILLKLRYQIEYKYHIEDNFMILSIINERLAKNIDFAKTSDLFGISYGSFDEKYTGGIQFLSSMRSSAFNEHNMLTFKVCINDLELSSDAAYFLSKLKPILLSLPERSPALDIVNPT